MKPADAFDSIFASSGDEPYIEPPPPPPVRCPECGQIGSQGYEETCPKCYRYVMSDEEMLRAYDIAVRGDQSGTESCCERTVCAA